MPSHYKENSLNFMSRKGFSDQPPKLPPGVILTVDDDFCSNLEIALKDVEMQLNDQ